MATNLQGFQALWLQFAMWEGARMQTEFLLRCFPTRPTLFMPLKMLRSIQGDAYKGSSEQLLFLWDRVFHGVQKPSSPWTWHSRSCQGSGCKAKQPDRFSTCEFLADLLTKSRGRAVLGHWQSPDVPGNLSAIFQR